MAPRSRRNVRLGGAFSFNLRIERTRRLTNDVDTVSHWGRSGWWWHRERARRVAGAVRVHWSDAAATDAILGSTTSWPCCAARSPIPVSPGPTVPSSPILLRRSYVPFVIEV